MLYGSGKTEILKSDQTEKKVKSESYISDRLTPKPLYATLSISYLGTDVWNLELIGILPCLSFAIPISSRPRFSVYGRLPIHTRSVSQST